MSDYDPQDDAVKSYYAAIEAKRLRGDALPSRADEKVADTSASEANTCGRAGEHLVCADFLSRGHEAFIAEGRLPYDVVADIDGRMIRIQVKTTSGIKPCPQRKNHTPVYMWNARKFGKGSRHSYSETDADLVAYVALDRKQIAYRTTTRIAQSTVLRIAEYRDQYQAKTGAFIEDFPLEKALAEIGS
jgi:hypothetical protein